MANIAKELEEKKKKEEEKEQVDHMYLCINIIILSYSSPPPSLSRSALL